MRKTDFNQNLKGQAGFTIIEFLVSTLGFSIVLLIMTFGIISFMTDYYKVTLGTTVQVTANNVASAVENSIELSSNSTDTPSYYPPTSTGSQGIFCAGNEEFAYYLGKEVPTETSYALYEFVPTGSNCDPNPSTSSAAWKAGRSLLGDQYRLITFTYSPIKLLDSTGNPVNSSPPEAAIDIKIAYTSGGVNNTGDDLLCSPGVAGSCSSNAPDLTDFTKSDIECKGQAGSQFCYVVALQSEVGQHIN